MLELIGVSVRLADKMVMEGIDLQVTAGEGVLIHGPIGAGKTTLLRAIAGLERPVAGEIRCDGVMWCGRTWQPPWRRSVGMVFQDLALWPGLGSVEQLAHVVPVTGPQRMRDRRACAHALLREWGLESIATKAPDELSGGQQQLIALLRALMRRANLLLLDEPTAHLDASTVAETVNRLRERCQRHGTRLVVVSHRVVDGLASRSLTLSRGTLTCD